MGQDGSRSDATEKSFGPGELPAEGSERRFLSLLEPYVDFLKKAGKPVFRSSAVETSRVFGALSEAHKERVLSRLEAEIELFKTILSAGGRISDSRQLVWRYMQRFQFAPCSDIFDKINDSDVVEIYGLDQVHLFQNPNFFDWVSVSIERVLCEPWFKNSRRDPEVQGLILESARRVLQGEVTGTLDIQCPWHFVEEHDSEHLFRFQLRVKYLSPVYLRQALVAVVAVNECRDLQRQKG